MVDINLTISIITFNLNGLNAPIKRDFRVYQACKKLTLRHKDIYRSKVNGWRPWLDSSVGGSITPSTKASWV